MQIYLKGAILMAKKSEVMKDEGVKITLGNKDFEVKFDLNALCNLQDEFGELDEAFKSLDMKDLKKIRKLLRIALANGENIDITELEVGALINLDNIHEVTDTLTKALNGAMPSTTEEGK